MNPVVQNVIILGMKHELAQMYQILKSVRNLFQLAEVLKMDTSVGEFDGEKDSFDASISDVSLSEGCISFKMETYATAKTAVLRRWINSVHCLDRIDMLYMACDGSDYWITNDAYGVHFAKYILEFEYENQTFYCDNLENVVDCLILHIPDSRNILSVNSSVMEIKQYLEKIDSQIYLHELELILE